jgi:hypothetical protein
MTKGALSVYKLSRCASSLQLTSRVTLGTEKQLNRTMMNGALNVCRLSRRSIPSQLATGLTRRCFGTWPKVNPLRVRVITMVSFLIRLLLLDTGFRVCVCVCRVGAVMIYVMDMATTKRRANCNLVVFYCHVGCNGNPCFLLRKTRRALLGGGAKVRRRHVSGCTHR